MGVGWGETKEPREINPWALCVLGSSPERN